MRFSHLDTSYCYENFYESWNIRDGWLILKVLLISIFLLLKCSPQNDLVILLQFAGCRTRKDGENENSLFFGMKWGWKSFSIYIDAIYFHGRNWDLFKIYSHFVNESGCDSFGIEHKNL